MVYFDRFTKRHLTDGGDLAVATSRAGLLRLVAALADADPTVSGATVIMPDGEFTYVDAAMLRSGGTA
jgi:hypothetical protein